VHAVGLEQKASVVKNTGQLEAQLFLGEEDEDACGTPTGTYLAPYFGALLARGLCNNVGTF
jgi:hypothetical protein